MHDKIVAAYEAICLNPCQDEYYIARADGALCCPLTALAIAVKIVVAGEPYLSQKVYRWAVAEFGEDWVLGFQDGWDWRWPGPASPETKLYEQGFEAGKAVFKAIVVQ